MDNASLPVFSQENSGMRASQANSEAVGTPSSSQPATTQPASTSAANNNNENGNTTQASGAYVSLNNDTTNNLLSLLNVSNVQWRNLVSEVLRDSATTPTRPNASTSTTNVNNSTSQQPLAANADNVQVVVESTAEQSTVSGASNASSTQQPSAASATNAAPTTNAATATANVNLAGVPHEFSISREQFSSIIFKFLPAIAIVILFVFYNHALPILIFTWFFATSVTTNERVKQQISLKENRNIGVLLSVMIQCAGPVLFALFWFSTLKLYTYFMYDTSHLEKSTIWNCMWVTVTIDFMVKLLCVMVKAFFYIIFGGTTAISNMQKGRMLSILEYSFQLYRISLPVAIWVRYLFGSGYQIIFNVVILSLYTLYKCQQSIERVTNLLKGLSEVLRNSTSYGRYANQQEVMEFGEEDCPVCKEDFNKPIILGCNHLFCEECATAWLDQHHTCPLCRATVQKAGKAPCANGSTDLSVYVL